MPCRDYEGRDYSRENDLRMQNDRLASMLCEACALLEHTNVGLQGRLSSWWIQHKEADRKAAEARKQERIKEQKIQKALAKLTEEDKKLLRVK